jgi:hypothetical protein
LEVYVLYNLEYLYLVQETSKKAVLSYIEQEDKFQEEEIVELALKDIGFI